MLKNYNNNDTNINVGIEFQGEMETILQALFGDLQEISPLTTIWIKRILTTHMERLIR
jgi:hypothetical protein